MHIYIYIYRERETYIHTYIGQGRGPLRPLGRAGPDQRGLIIIIIIMIIIITMIITIIITTVYIYIYIYICSVPIVPRLAYSIALLYK